MNKRFVFVHNIPSPYRLHLFAEMHRQLSALGVDFQVYFMSDMSKGYDCRPVAWRNPKITFPHVYWKDYGYKHYDFNPGMICDLLRTPPDWIYVGSCYDSFTGIALSLLPLRKTVKCTGLEGNTKTTGTMDGFKGWVKRLVLSRYSYVAVPGRQGVAHMELHQKRTSRKMPKCVFLPNIIDESKFVTRNRWKEDDIRAIRGELGVAEHELLAITPARLNPAKGLVEYLSLLSSELLENWRIVIVGQGALKESLLSLSKERGIAHRVLIKDFVPYSVMPKFYAAADLFVLPSMKDPNPLSVVEALHSGLPVAVSEMAGNVDEAVTDGRNGWVLPVKDQDAYSKVLRKMFATPVEKLREMGGCSKSENSQFWNTQVAVANFLESIGIG